MATVTSQQCMKKYGNPYLPETQSKHFIVWQVPEDIRQALKHVFFSAVGTVGFPKRIFCNKDMVGPLEKFLRNIIDRGFAQELKTWDGCYILRSKRGLTSLSIHCWGAAIDVNQATNQLGKKPTLSAGFIKCGTDAGLENGGAWSRPDGMHFQLAKLG